MDRKTEAVSPPRYTVVVEGVSGAGLTGAGAGAGTAAGAGFVTLVVEGAELCEEELGR